MNVIRKRKSGSKKPKGKAREANQEKTKSLEQNVDEENPLDFGGLPERNLKKNLGCG